MLRTSVILITCYMYMNVICGIPLCDRTIFFQHRPCDIDIARFYLSTPFSNCDMASVDSISVFGSAAGARGSAAEVKSIFGPDADALARAAEAKNADMNIVSPEYCHLLGTTQCIADSMWADCGEEIVGAKGFRAVRLLGVATSHPDFPIFSTALATMPSLANGLTIQLWHKSKRPSVVVCPMFNGNYSQTRIAA